MSGGKTDTLRGLVNASNAQQTFLGYLVLQGLVLLLWWPKHSLFERIDSTGEPSTLAAVVIFTGAALAYFTLQPSTDEAPASQSRPSALRTGEDAPERRIWPSSNLLSDYRRIHLIRLGYLMALCTPITLVAHSIASVPATHLLWIAAITAVHTIFYRLLGSWLRLRWAERELLHLVIASRVALVAIYLCTTIYVPSLSHVRMSFQLVQPLSNATSPVATFVLPFIVTYAVLSALLCIGLVRQLSKRRADGTPESETGP